MNKHFITGRITKDLELEHFGEKNTAKLQFGLAVNRKYKNSKGDYDVDFFNCVAFGTVAENIAKFFKKGSFVLLEGTMQNDKYENKEGKTVNNWQYHAEGFEFCGSANKTEKSEPKMTQIAQDDGMPF